MSRAALEAAVNAAILLLVAWVSASQAAPSYRIPHPGEVTYFQCTCEECPPKVGFYDCGTGRYDTGGEAYASAYWEFRGCNDESLGTGDGCGAGKWGGADCFGDTGGGDGCANGCCWAWGDEVLAMVTECFANIWGETEEGVRYPRGTGSCEENANKECDQDRAPAYEGDPVDIYNGTMVHRETDLEDPVAAPFDLGVKRIYRSGSQVSGTLGNRWSLTFVPALELRGSGLVRFLDGSGNIDSFVSSGGVFHGPANGRTLLRLGDGSYELTDPGRGWVYAFDSTGKISEIRGKSDTALSYQYDGSGLLSAVADGEGRSVTLEYSGGKVAAVRLNGQEVVGFTYAGNELVTATYPGGAQKRYEYSTLPNGRTLLARVLNEESREVASWTYSTNEIVPGAGHSVLQAKGKGASGQFSFEYSSPRVVTDGFGKRRTYAPGSVGLAFTAVSGPACSDCGGEKGASWTYDLLERPTEKVDRRGNVSRYGDYVRGGPGFRIDAAGTPKERRTDFEYHPSLNEKVAERTASVVAPSGVRETISDYDDDLNSAPNEFPGDLLRRRVERGFTRDINGGIVPFEYVTTYAYNAQGRVTSIDGPRTDASDVTSFSYDATTGAMATVATPSGTTTFSNFDALGYPRRVTDPNGNHTDLAYDARGRLTQTTDVKSGAVTAYEYDAAGKLEKITLPRGNSLTFTRAANGEVETITDSVGNQIRYGYDAMNNRTTVEVRDPQGTLRRSLPLSFDNPADSNWPGLLWRVRDPAAPESVFTEFAYDPNRNLSRLTDPDGNATDFGYDPLDRLASVTQAIGGESATTAYGYDLHGNLVSVTDAEGRVTTFESDDLGRVTAVVSPDSGTTRYEYDESGNLVEKKDAANNLTTYAYDGANRVTSISAAGEMITLGYDEADVTNGKARLTRVVDGSGTTRYDYDSLGRVTRQRSTMGAVTYTTGYGYDPNGNLIELTYPSGIQVLYDYDQGDRVSRVRIEQGGSLATLAEEVRWMPFGPVKGWKYGNGLAASRNYDLQYRLTDLYAGNLSRSYGYNHSGDVTGVALHIPEPAPAPAPERSYGYPAGSNRLESVTPQGESATSLSYDPRGNVTGYGDKAFTYDALGRLTETRIGGNLVGSYAYNFRNQRVKKVAGSTTTVYHYDLSGNLIEESTAAGSKSYVYLGSQLGSVPLGMVSGGSVYEYHTDHLGTPQRLSNAAGATVWEAGYSAFGNATVNQDPDGDGTAVVSNLRLPGQYLDAETGLHYNWHRSYSPELGRYLQPDPLGLSGATSPYLYAANQPLALGDPSGLKPFSFKFGPGGGVGHLIVGGGVYLADITDRQTREVCKYQIRCLGIGVGLPDTNVTSAPVDFDYGNDCASCKDFKGGGFIGYAAAKSGYGFSLGGYVKLPNGPLLTGNFFNLEYGGFTVGTAHNYCWFALVSQ